jgi:hypothetical protein
MRLAEWASAVGEFLIAWVIFWEMEQNRRESFLNTAHRPESYEARRKTYAAFHATPGGCMAEKSKAFFEAVWGAGSREESIRESCEEQLSLFGRLGQIYRRAWINKQDYVKLFPQAVVMYWMMLEPYIADRRALTGEWWASDFETLTSACLEFLLRNPRASLTMHGLDRETENLIVHGDELRSLQQRLKP